MSRLARILLWSFAIVSLFSGAALGVGIWRYRAHLEQTLAQGQRYELSALERVPKGKAKEPQVSLVFKTPQGTTRQLDGYAVSPALYDKLGDHPSLPMHVRVLGDPVTALPLLEEDSTWLIWRAGRLLWGPLFLIVLGGITLVITLRVSRPHRGA